MYRYCIKVRSSNSSSGCIGTQAEDWLYTDGEDAGVTDFQIRLETLKDSGETIFFRSVIPFQTLLNVFILQEENLE